MMPPGSMNVSGSMGQFPLHSSSHSSSQVHPSLSLAFPTRAHCVVCIATATLLLPHRVHGESNVQLLAIQSSARLFVSPLTWSWGRAGA